MRSFRRDGRRRYPKNAGAEFIEIANSSRCLDQATRFGAIVGMTFPVFWLALMMSRYFGVELGWLPVSGYDGEGFFRLPAPPLPASRQHRRTSRRSIRARSISRRCSSRLPPSTPSPRDHLGRDVFNRTIHAICINLWMGVASVAAPLVLGTLAGEVPGIEGARRRQRGDADPGQAGQRRAVPRRHAIGLHLLP
ncbi:hypothetical protein ACUSIJ_09755 [Pseudochelatococcus sp. B33]